MWHLFDIHHLGGEGAEKLKAQASELLTMYALLRHFFETVVGDVDSLRAERASFDACCVVVDTLMLAKRGVLDLGSAARTLRRASADHIRKHTAAYSDERLKPKHLWLFSVADAMARDSARGAEPILRYPTLLYFILFYSHSIRTIAL